MSQAILYNSAQVSAGQSFIFNSIIAVVIGGVLLTGGYGSVVGIVLGTLTFSIVNQGIFYTGFDANWASLIIGVLLLLAVLMNNTFRNMALVLRSRARRRRSAHDNAPAQADRNLQVVRSDRRASRHFARGEPRRGAVPARRQWRRQVDAHQDPLRASTSRRRARWKWTARPSRSTAPATPATMGSRPSTSSAARSR